MVLRDVSGTEKIGQCATRCLAGEPRWRGGGAGLCLYRRTSIGPDPSTCYALSGTGMAYAVTRCP
eukprot:2360300-Rhodomonas_salina.2